MRSSLFERWKWVMRLGVEQIALSEEFHQILEEIIQKLEGIKNTGTADDALFMQIFLHVIGERIRSNIPQDYYPETLREPYLRRVLKREMCAEMFGRMALVIRRGAVVAETQESRESCYKYFKQVVSSNVSLFLSVSTIKHHEGGYSQRLSEEILGWFVVSSLYRRFTSMVVPCDRILGSGVGMLGARATLDKHLLQSKNYEKYRRMEISTPLFETRSSSSSKAKQNSRCLEVADENVSNPFVESSIEDEITSISSNFFGSDVEKVCEKLQGHILPESLRGHLWMFRCLHRLWGDPPEGPSIISKLVELGAKRGIPLETIDNHVLSKYTNSKTATKSISELTRTTVEEVYIEGFSIRREVSSHEPSRPSTAALKTHSPTVQSFVDKAVKFYANTPSTTSLDSSNEDSSSSETSSPRTSERSKPKEEASRYSSDTSLLRRSEVLLRAEYILSGGVCRRGAAVALMVLNAFQEASPISEKILRLFRHIHYECLPSEQMRHSYSISSIAKSAFAMLHREDAMLYAHIQKVFEHEPDVAPDVHHNVEIATDETDKRRVPSLPPPSDVPSASYILLHPWLETGFVGYLSEFSVYYIWDQCFLFGGRANDWRTVLPIACYAILKLLKDELLQVRDPKRMQRLLLESSKSIRTKMLIMLLRPRLQALPRNKWFASPYSGASLTLDKIRAVVLLQKLGRGWKDRKRVEAIQRQRREERERKLAAESAGVRDWVAEVQREAEQWRAEFLRRKEEAEAEAQVALEERRREVAAALSDLLDKIEAAPAEKVRKVEKSAYQIEWERLQSHSSGDISDSSTDQESQHDFLEEEKTDTELNSTAAEDGESRDCALFVIDSLLTRTFEELHRKKMERKRAAKAESHRRRQGVIATIDHMISVLEEREERARSERVSIQEEATTSASPAVEDNKQLAMNSSSSSKSSNDEKNLQIRSEVSTLLEEMIVKVEKRDTANKDNASVSSTKHITANETSKTLKKQRKAPTEEEVDEEYMESEKFRSSLPRIEVDAVAGFFEESRSALKTLQEEKTRLKSVIGKWKKRFEKSHGRPSTWEERKGEIGQVYEDYHEVCFNLRLISSKLRQDEDNLLRRWQRNKTRKQSSHS